MATISKWTKFDVALDLTATAGTVTRTSATQFTVVFNVSWKTSYSGNKTNYGMSASAGGKTLTLNPFGTKSSGSSGSFTGTFSISGNGAATKTTGVTFKFFNSDNGNSASTTINLDVSVPAWTSYTVTYNANGGSGAPSSQTKWKNQTLTLSSTKPTRTGYSFQGWALSKADADSGAWYYAAGASCGKNENLTLYAVWKANTYTVTYNANGGSGAPAKQTKIYGKTLTLSTTKPTRTNYNFLGWSDSASATTAKYSAGAGYTANVAVTLYAVWELAYVKPSIEITALTRSEDGRSVTVSCSWTTAYAAKTIDIQWESNVAGAIEANSYGKNLSLGESELRSYTHTFVNELDPETPYTISVRIADSVGYNTASKTLPGVTFTMDFLAGGKGVAFGKAATEQDLLDIQFKARMLGGLLYPVLAEGTDLDTVLTPNWYVGENVSTIPYQNCPIASGTFTLEVVGAGPAGQVTQRLYQCDKNIASAYERTYYGGTWGDWYGAWMYPTLGSEFQMYGTSEADNRVRYRKDGRIVELRGAVTPINDIAGGTEQHVICSLPNGYRPNSPIYILCQGSSNCIWLLRVNTNGNVEFSRYRNGETTTTATAGTWLPFQVTYLAK